MRALGQNVEFKVARRGRRKGNVIVLTAFLMIVMLALVALSVDVGYVYTLQAQLQRSVDAAALAGAGQLVEGPDVAQATATEYLVRNPVGSSMSVIDESALASTVTTFKNDHKNDYQLKVGNWNPNTRTFEESNVMPSTMSVTMTYPNMPLFFARALGRDSVNITASSVAMYQPRDIVLVLDFSGSMNDDSEFSAISKLGQSEVEGNLAEIYSDLGSPTYGNLQFAPQWATAHGVPQNDAQGIPHISVEYRNSSVFITSTSNLTTVKVEFSNSNQQSWSPSSTSTGTFTGSGGNAGKQIRKVWVNSGNNTVQFGSNGEYFDFTSGNINTTLKKALGLNTVTYPYASGSWDAYIDWVEASGNQNANAGYRYKFGYMNLIVWWLEARPAYNQTADLWKVRAEPINALKDSVAVFMDFIGAVDTQDRVALAIYNAANGEGMIEKPFTSDYDSISTTVSQRQAGHYHSYTNIGAGLHEAREHLDAHARPNAKKLIVLMTDGQANWVNGAYNESAANQYLIDEANLCAADARKYEVFAISMGAGADTSIMQQVATITDGTHFNVPGGSSQSDYYNQLYDTFEDIAKARPLKLVK
ncbi:MAG: VWA domain-containing protein [Pirellulaceae bacterium]|nr:VWA domain-containing protein [Pirellulaceae bacterium]